jgi:anti-sigma B factor antagonist
MLSMTTHEVSGVLVITLEVSVDSNDEGQAAQRQALYRAIQDRVDPRFAVDLGKVSYMSSADFGFLISVKRRVDARKGKLVIFDIDSYILDTLATMKLLSLFRIADDLTGALLLLPMGDP